jgi:protein gp37
MAENSAIEWTDHTFNPWTGCTKVSDGCKHCYAETLMDHRYHKVKWGPQGKRLRTAKQYWKQPLKWNETWFVECDVCGQRQVFNQHGRCSKCQHPMVATMRRARQRVFCASLADVFEEKRDQMEEMDQWRSELVQLIEQTPNLDWLLLTKRPENVEWMLEVALFSNGVEPQAGAWLKAHPNVWIGTSVENQKMADERIPHLVRIPARIHFLSVEPMLGPIDLDLRGKHYGIDYDDYSEDVSWVIGGFESGSEARVPNPDDMRSLRDQCRAADIPFFFKQWGEWMPRSHMWYAGLKEDMTFKKKPVQMGNEIMVPVGKHRSGNFLDGLEWQEFPILNRQRISLDD